MSRLTQMILNTPATRMAGTVKRGFEVQDNHDGCSLLHKPF
jgi:hypothetical protein